MAVRATLLGGFLGAGKTTLLNALLRDAGQEPIAVLVNDFGGLSVDAELIARADERTIELTNGCVCCNIAGDLIEAVRRVLLRPAPPNRLVVELSGVADTATVARTFRLLEQAWPVDLDGVIEVVDGAALVEAAATEADATDDGLRTTRREAVTALLERAAAADLLVLSKLDLLAPAQQAQARALLRSQLPNARVCEAAFGAVPRPLLFGARLEEGELAVDRDPRAPAPVGTASALRHGYWTCAAVERSPLSRDRARALLLELPRAVVRAKGILYLAGFDHRAVLQVVGRRARLDRGAAWGSAVRESRLVLIGSEPMQGQEAAEVLARCRASWTERLWSLTTARAFFTTC